MAENLLANSEKYRDLIMTAKELETKKRALEMDLEANRKRQDTVATELRKCCGANIPERHIVLEGKMVLVITQNTVKLVQGE